MRDELKALRDKHAKEENELLLELSIKDDLPDVGVPWRVHGYPLYGTVASAHVDHNWFDYTGKTPKPTLETVRQAAELLPPEPMVKVRDGSLSFRPKGYVESLPEEKKERWEEEQDVTPFLVEVCGFQHLTAEFNWFTKLKSGAVVRVEITLPMPRELGTYTVVRQHGPRAVEQAIKRCEFIPDTDRVLTLFDGTEPVAQLESPIRWASGSPTTPNKFTMYWVELRDDWKPTTAAALVAALTK